MDGDARTVAGDVAELDALDLEMLELLGTTGYETREPQHYKPLLVRGLAVAHDAGCGFTWIGQTPAGRRLVRRSRRP